jgi:protein-disulfide isomerase
MFLKSLGVAILALGLAACGEQSRASLSPVEGDSFLGPANAKVVVTEYAAPTCPVCKSWHDLFWAQLKSAYIDTGKIKFVMRELPSHNPPVDAAIFAIARCAGPADFFPVLDEAFARQQQIEIAARSGQATEALVSLGNEFRLSETQVQACIRDPKNAQRIFDMQDEATARGVVGTPTFFVNDEMVQGRTMDAVWAQTKLMVDAALAASAPAAPAAPAQTPAETPAETPAAPEQH